MSSRRGHRPQDFVYIDPLSPHSGLWDNYFHFRKFALEKAGVGGWGDGDGGGRDGGGREEEGGGGAGGGDGTRSALEVENPSHAAALWDFSLWHPCLPPSLCCSLVS